MASSLPKARILCVDDNLQLLQALTASLAAYRFDVIPASNGIEALSLFTAHDGNFVAVLTDNEMPTMNGVDLVRSLRQKGYAGPIVVMSGNLTASDCRAYQDFAVNGFFKKPFEISLFVTLFLEPSS